MVVIQGEGHQINGEGVVGFEEENSVFREMRESDSANHYLYTGCMQTGILSPTVFVLSFMWITLMLNSYYCSKNPFSYVGNSMGNGMRYEMASSGQSNRQAPQ